jgi:hypothetical protein
VVQVRGVVLWPSAVTTLIARAKAIGADMSRSGWAAAAPSPDRGVAVIMELINGPSLHNLIYRGVAGAGAGAGAAPASPWRALAPAARGRILLKLTLALQHMHHHNIVHGDVKPANVAVAWPGSTAASTAADLAAYLGGRSDEAALAAVRVTLIDLGLSRTLHRRGDGADHGGGGTFPYTAPERFDHSLTDAYPGVIESERVKLQLKEDIWSLGCVAMEAASGDAFAPSVGPSAAPRVVTGAGAGAGDVGADAYPFNLERCRPELKEWLKNCWRRDVGERMNAVDAGARLLKLLARPDALQLLPPPASSGPGDAELRRRNFTERQLDEVLATMETVHEWRVCPPKAGNRARPTYALEPFTVEYRVAGAAKDAFVPFGDGTVTRAAFWALATEAAQDVDDNRNLASRDPDDLAAPWAAFERADARAERMRVVLMEAKRLLSRLRGMPRPPHPDALPRVQAFFRGLLAATVAIPRDA